MIGNIKISCASPFKEFEKVTAREILPQLAVMLLSTRLVDHTSSDTEYRKGLPVPPSCFEVWGIRCWLLDRATFLHADEERRYVESVEVLPAIGSFPHEISQFLEPIRRA